MKLEVFFDYSCPFCLRGHGYLTELLPDYPDLEVIWRPCEAHPRPDRYGPHSDWCAKGMFYAKDCGTDLAPYHQQLYQAAVTERLNIENLSVVSNVVTNLLDEHAFQQALSEGAYSEELAESNRLAWEVYQFSAVPSLRMNGRELRAVEGLGLTREMISDFLSSSEHHT